MGKKTKLAVLVILLLMIFLGVISFQYYKSNKENNVGKNFSVNLNTLTMGKKETSIKSYSQDDFSTFKEDYNNDKLPSLYVTEFLFDGVSMYKPYDLDDFIDNGNDYHVEPLNIKVLNINKVSDVTLAGDFTGMIAINSNNLEEDMNVILNNVSIDTDSKKVPAIYVYNKDILYNNHNVTIKTLEGTKNYITGGKLKKVSLIESDNLTNYSNNYTGDASTNYQDYTNYYGVYNSEDVKNVLFAKVTADREDLQYGDPYYYYKGSGAISSDIDLYFEGNGYLEVTSKNKEGIETKGNLSLLGGTGDYVVNAMDDCLNTTTDSSEINNAHNTMVIDVNSLKAIVSLEADEGDAIDSNGTLTIYGGKIIALSKPGQDAGLDSEDGVYINGGEIISTGDMYNEVSSGSNQQFMVLSFSKSVENDTLITLIDSNDNVVFSFINDRNYTSLIYSSNKLTDGTYYLYKNGDVEGQDDGGFYSNVGRYSKGIQLGYTQTGISGGMGGPNMDLRDNNENPPAMNENSERPSMPDDANERMNGNKMMQGQQNDTGNATNKEFVISGIQNLFGGVGELSE